MDRNTYAEINLTNLRCNVAHLVERYAGYQYYFGVVKADCYGHNGLPCVQAMLRGGCSYLAVASLEEAIVLREAGIDAPILCLGVVPPERLKRCIEYGVTVTVSSIEYLDAMLRQKLAGLQVHIKVDTGMHRLGLQTETEVTEAFRRLRASDLRLEGIYTHIYDAANDARTEAQFARFEAMTTGIDLAEIPIVHVGASDATMRFPRRAYANGCRLGIAMYGLGDTADDALLPTFRLISEVVQVNAIEAGDTVGYGGNYRASGRERIAVVCIGYADGVIRKNTGRMVYINGKPYPIVGNICMDMLFVRVDDTVQCGDRVEIIRDIPHIRAIAAHLDTITYEVICSVGKRVPRIYTEE